MGIESPALKQPSSLPISLIYFDAQPVTTSALPNMVFAFSLEI
jgi:hypothetical protein